MHKILFLKLLVQYKMKSFNTIIILFVIIFSACNKTNEIVFDKTYEIKGDLILSEEIGIHKLIVANEYLLGYTFQKEHFFKVFNLETLEEIGEIAKKGGGPNEFSTFLIFNYVDNKEKNTCLWAHDLNTGELYLIDILLSLSEGNIFSHAKFKLPAAHQFYTAYFIDSTRIIGRSTNNIIEMSRLQGYDSKNDSMIFKLPLFPEIFQKENDVDFTLLKYNPLYISNLTFNSEMNLVASAMTDFNRIDIFDVQGNLIRTIEESDRNINGKKFAHYFKSDEGKNNLIYYYKNIDSSSKFIYALFYGKSRSNKTLEKDKVELRVFDWQGKPIVKILIQDPINEISIDEINGFIYAVDNENDKLLRYDIKFLLNEII